MVRDREAALNDLKTTVNSPGYAMLRERMETMLEQQRMRLEGDQSDKSTVECRASIQTLRRVLNLPEILRNELSA